MKFGHPEHIDNTIEDLDMQLEKLKRQVCYLFLGIFPSNNINFIMDLHMQLYY